MVKATTPGRKGLTNPERPGGTLGKGLHKKAVIPALMAYTKVAAVETLVVGGVGAESGGILVPPSASGVKEENLGMVPSFLSVPATRKGGGVKVSHQGDS